MRTASLVTLLLTLVGGAAYATEYLQTLKEGSWVCSTPEAYDVAVAEERNWQGAKLEELKRDLLERRLCMYVDAEYVEKMMVPFATVVERQGNKVKVTFTVEFRKRLEILHRQITRVTFAGWTDAGNLRDKEIL
ncbi:MAG: hypothetical protein DMD82_16825 [Candidatus Rokuibacteriota bacterium]|nr:MAG: hypothetical protein DMD82_16825 [Candidatus Rokubacteria bacterium]